MTRYQPPSLFRFANRLVARLIKLGLPMGVRRAPMALLTVPGRNSGIPRTTPVALAEREDGWLLISVNGLTDWAQNLKAAGEATITRRGSTVAVTARAVPPVEAAPILREAMTEAPAFVRNLTSRHFEADADSPTQTWQRDAVSHPVFILTPT